MSSTCISACIREGTRPPAAAYHNEISSTAKNLQILNPKSSIGNKRTSNIKICTGKTTNRWEYYHLADLGFILVLGQI
jgi:hypothetical protein